MVGDANHYFNRKLVERLKVYNNDILIDFFSVFNPDTKLVMPYDNVFNASIKDKSFFSIFRIRGIRGVYTQVHYRTMLLKILDEKEYDCIHFQSIPVWAYTIFKNWRLRNKLLITTVWGSDFYRASKRSLRKIRKIVMYSDKITFATNAISLDFDMVFNSIKKHVIVRFGLEVFDYIDSLHSVLKEGMIDNFRKKVVITIGYNRHPAQQHLKIIDSLSILPDEIKNRLKIVLPFTYGAIHSGYLEQINKKLDLLGIEYIIKKDFMAPQEIAYNCVNSDIMIQLQKTDAFSGSMQEYMYAGNIILTGEWLPYQDLKNCGVYFLEVPKVEDVGKLLLQTIEDMNLHKQNCLLNKIALKKLSGWEYNIQKWNALYDKKNFKETL